MIELIFLHDFARSAKIKCGGFDWTKFHTFKHVHLSLISVVYLLYLIIIGTFLCACLCVNIWRIIALLLAFYETKGILVILTMWCVSHVGGSQVGPIYTLGGASVEISWQEGRLDDKHSKSHQDASSYPEVDLHPEVTVLTLADKELHPEVDSHPVDSHPEVNVLALAVWSLASGSQSPSVSECKSQTAQWSEMSTTFQKSLVQS